MSFAHMKTMLDIKGNTIRLSKINDGKRLMANQLMTDPSYQDSFVIWEFGQSPDDRKAVGIKTFNEKYSSANGFSIGFNTLIDDKLSVGDVLLNTKTNIYWLCTESYNRDDILCAGILTRCNNRLKWQDDEGKIFEYPVFDINSTQYNSGTAGDKIVTLGSTQHMFTITADENTTALNHDKRFFVDRNTKNPTVFKLTQNDTTAMNYDKGLLRITLLEDQYNPNTDSIENWLCDYFPVSSSVTIHYADSPTIRAGGTKALNVDTDEIVQWYVDSDIGATVISNGNSAKVKCPYDSSFVDKTITVIATVGDNSEQCVLTVTGGV